MCMIKWDPIAFPPDVPVHSTLLVKLKYRPRSVLDLACGTGTAAVLWAKNNIKTYGIDGSIRCWRSHKRKSGSSMSTSSSRSAVDVVHSAAEVDLVTCYYDSLNYLLTLSELTAAMNAARNVLHEDGYFIFDVNTPKP